MTKSNLWKEEFIWDYSSRGEESIMVSRHGSKQQTWRRGQEVESSSHLTQTGSRVRELEANRELNSNPASSDTLPFIKATHPKVVPPTVTGCYNAWVYGETFSHKPLKSSHRLWQRWKPRLGLCTCWVSALNTESLNPNTCSLVCLFIPFKSFSFPPVENHQC